MKDLFERSALEMLSDPCATVVPYAERYKTLGAHVGIDMGAVIATFDGLPLANDGPVHKALRQATAQYLGKMRPAVKAALPSLVDRHMAPLATPGTVDVMPEVVRPLIDAMTAVLTKVDHDFGPDSLVSRLFSQSMGPRKRMRLNAELSALRDAFQTVEPETLDERVTLAVLGRDAALGTVSLSLADHFEAVAGRPVNAERFESVPTRTGVPYVDRVIDGQDFRCRLQSLEGQEADVRQNYFGKGAHLCLGRAITLDLFAEMARWLGGCTRRVRVVALELRKDDVFHLPGVFRIEVSEDE